MKEKPGFCYEIFKNQAFWSNNGSISYNPCSFFNGFIDHSIEPDQSWYGPNRAKVIDIVSQGYRVPGCHRCYEEEASGRTSRRQASAQNYETFSASPELPDSADGPEGLDYSVGNLCNLKCMICGPSNSSAWLPDYQKIFPAADITGYQYQKHNQIKISNKKFLTKLKNIHFHGGGEPLMSSAHIDLLKLVQDAKGLGDVRVFYNTNATQTVSDEVLKIWEQCKLVEIYFSIDDIAHRFEYQRTGAKWLDVLTNIDWFKKNMPHNHMFKVNCVWSYLNLYYLDELEAWHRHTLPANRYGDPCALIYQQAIGHFKVTHLGSKAYHMLEQKFAKSSTLTGLLSNIKIEEKDHSRFWSRVNQIDAVRHNNFRTVCPEWSAWL